MSLLLVGPSQTGKTKWARCLGKHIYFNTYFNLDKFDADAKYAIFDDIPFDFMKYQYKGWWGGQEEFECTDKYRKKITISWGRPCIILMNDQEYEKACLLWDQSWMDANVVMYTVRRNLF